MSDRNYDSARGSFPKTDRLMWQSPSISPYAYCNANPLRLTDPNGMQAIEIAGRFLYGFFVDGPSGIIKAAAEQGKFFLCAPCVAYEQGRDLLDGTMANKIEQTYKTLTSDRGAFAEFGGHLVFTLAFYHSVGAAGVTTVAAGSAATGEATAGEAAAGETASGQVVKKFGDIREGQARVIQHFANKYNVTVDVIGSHATGTAGPASDFDYVIGGNARIRAAALRELPRGEAGGSIRPDGTESGIDVFNANVESTNLSKPYIRFEPQK